MSLSNHITLTHCLDNVTIIICNYLLVNNTSIGGCRHGSYKNLHEAILDAYDLSYAMSLKAVAQNLDTGGSKCVIYNPKDIPFEAIAPHLGKALNDLGGKYYTSIDIGISSKELDILSKYTEYLYGTSQQSDPSTYTANGYLAALKAVINKIDKPSHEIKINIQGLGKVGFLVAQYCLNKKYQVFGCDKNVETINPLLQYTNFTNLPIDKILTEPCDVLVPAANSNVINASNVNTINADYICSVANNPVENPVKLSEALKNRGIIYLPDFITNSGGLIYVSNQLKAQPSDWFQYDDIANKVNAILENPTRLSAYNQALLETGLGHS